MTSHSRRPGFTFITLLVIMAFIAFLAALFIPLFAQVRQQAQRTDAFNNLRQLTIACHSFHDTHNRMPPGIGKHDNRLGSAHFYLLPFLEQQQVYNQGNAGSAQVSDQVLQVFLDASDKLAPKDHLYNHSLALTNFAANWLVFSEGKTKIQDITDGTSNTLMFATRYQICNGTPTVWAYDHLYYWAPLFAYYSQAKFQSQPKQEDCDPALPQSLGNPNLTVGICDGSVRTLNPRLEAGMWWNGCRPSDGNIVNFED